MSTRIRIHSSTQESSGNIVNKACVPLKYSIHGKELGSILLHHRIKTISGFSVHTFPDS